MVSKQEALRLATKCLPHLRKNKADLPETLTVGDVKLRKMCRLWAGMGHIYQVDLWDGQASFVLKHVTPPPRSRQSFGDCRKAKSYQVEANFYEKLADSLIQEQDIGLPTPFFVERGPKEDEITIAMSLLQGKPVDTMDLNQAKSVLSWMAKFHASHWGRDEIQRVVETVGLQPVASYWHLDTRPDEHESMSKKGWEGRLRRAAKAIDKCLKRDPMQCLVHGDTKDANMMMTTMTDTKTTPQQQLQQQQQVVMYDLQYCGQGTPTRDIAYFLCSSCDLDQEQALVEYYFQELVQRLAEKHPTAVLPTMNHFKDSLELAFCDYCRFMCGWGHWGSDLKGRAQTFLQRIDGGHDLGSEEAYDEAIRNELW